MNFESRPLTLACIILILLVTIGTYHRLVRAGFTNWDDPRTITENPLFAPPTNASLLKMWTSPQMDLYVPLTYTVWWKIDRASITKDVAGRTVHRPAAFHIANIALHAAACVVVFFILRSLLPIANRSSKVREISALAGALLFAVHPVQVESVAWISGLKDVLAGLLALLVIDQYIRFARSDGDHSRIGGRAIAHYIAAAVLLIAALLSKPSAITVPVIVLVIELFLLKRSPLHILISVAPLFAIAIPFLVIGKNVQMGAAVTTIVSPIVRPLLALDALTFYIRKLCWPAQLCVDYGRAPSTVLASGTLWWTTWPPLIAAVFGWRVARRFPLIVGGLLVFVAALAPVLGFVTFDFQEYSTVADHYLYLPMLGVAIAISGALITRPKTVTSAMCVLILALAVRSFGQTKHWMDSIALWQRATEVNPKSWNGFSNLAEALDEADRPAEAEPLARHAIVLRADNYFAHMVLGQVLLSRGEWDGAAQSFEEALRLRPSFVPGHVNLANAYGQQGRIDDAIVEYQRALLLDPANVIARRMSLRAKAYRDSLRAATTKRTMSTTMNAGTMQPAPPTTIQPGSGIR